jgi:hypothetical protein
METKQKEAKQWDHFFAWALEKEEKNPVSLHFALKQKHFDAKPVQSLTV